MNFGVKLDTNGTNPKRLKSLLAGGLVDYVAMDYKVPSSKMERVCGGSFSVERVQESLRFLIDKEVDHEIRTTVVPGIHKLDDMDTIAKEIGGAKIWVLQRFRGKGVNGEIFVGERGLHLLDEKDFDENFLHELQERYSRFFPQVKVRG